MLPADQKWRGWEVHLNVIRKSTRWIDWRISVTGDRSALVLPDLVRPEHLQSLIHFFYTGDYSIDASELSIYPTPPSPDGCATCSQICQLLRIHLSIFQTALLLRITDLQALAFRRFRDLMDTASPFVLQSAVRAVYTKRPIPDGLNNFQITGFKDVTDYRPELVLPAILRYCGYYRLKFQEDTGARNRRSEPSIGAKEFNELRGLSADFNRHMAHGLWLDSLNITVPTIQISPNFPPIRSLHPYMRMPSPSQLVMPLRSNYQYVSYLQPLPFRDFKDQNRYHTQAPPLGVTKGASTWPCWADVSADQTVRAPMQQTQWAPRAVTELPPTFSAEEQALLDALDQDMDFQPAAAAMAPDNSDPVNWVQAMDSNEVDSTTINPENLLGDEAPSQCGSAPFQGSAGEVDWTQILDWDAVGSPINFDAFLNDNTLSLPDGNLNGASGMDLDELDLSNVSFTDLLNDDSLGQFIDPTQAPMDLGLENEASVPQPFAKPDESPFDMEGLPPMDFSGLEDMPSPAQNTGLGSITPEWTPPKAKTKAKDVRRAGPRYRLRSREAGVSYVDLSD